MKVDPKTGLRYAHTPEEWAEVLRKHGAGMSLPASVAAQMQRQVAKPGGSTRLWEGHESSRLTRAKCDPSVGH